MAREIGVPASRLRLATLSSERLRTDINARRRPANSTGVAAPVGSGGTADVVVTFIKPRPSYWPFQTPPIVVGAPAANKNAVAYELARPAGTVVACPS
ncbi:hypothetical protein Aau02nite_32780 [Amorphoplanes auranticolor]|uniref:Uncharacterized protein n=1 Tax=Actinoplanes auranticolor TaxID=47988 RepID=A0A919SCV1_9ACTN|nr:hypothetical protein Aau02nite_32780 [Actinoplanes auranticolor]